MSLTCLANATFTDNAKIRAQPNSFKVNFRLVESELMGFYGTAVLNCGDSAVPRCETLQVFAYNRNNRKKRADV